MFRKTIFLFILGLGIFLIIQVLMPVISFKFWEYSLNQQNLVLASPISRSSQVLGISIQNTNFFPAYYSNNTRSTPLPYKEYELSIPSLNLDNLKVIVDTNDFDQSLAQLPGTALPGEKGNVFITGHSSLPQLFRPGNYQAIFAELPKIKKGDQINIKAGGQRFTYVVEGLRVVSPEEVWVINPPDNNGRYLSLMTCVPPGFYFKRLIVLAKLS